MSTSNSLSQQQVEHLTGLSREVLRKWELRYGFPHPARGSRGQRLYDRDTVEKLQLVIQLISSGERPGKLLSLPLIALRQTLDQSKDAREDSIAQTLEKLLACLGSHADPMAAQMFLNELVKKVGLSNFVEQYFTAFNEGVGQAWAHGRLAIHAEHHYSETIRNVVHRAISGLQCHRQAPRVLLTTPANELHGLGLLGVQAVLALCGAECLCLGTQTPVDEVVQAAMGFKVAVVAISISACYSNPSAEAYISALRRTLPLQVRLWVGGMGAKFLVSHPIEDVEVFDSTAQAAKAWAELVE